MTHTQLAIDALNKLYELDAALGEATTLLARLKALSDRRIYANYTLQEIRSILNDERAVALIERYTQEEDHE